MENTVNEQAVEATVVESVINTLNATELTIDELNAIADRARALADESEARFAKLFDLGDRVTVKDLGVQTVVRRNKWTVSVTDGKGGTVKVTPSDITNIVEQGDPDNFDYFDYFGEKYDETADEAEPVQA